MVAISPDPQGQVDAAVSALPVPHGVLYQGLEDQGRYRHIQQVRRDVAGETQALAEPDLLDLQIVVDESQFLPDRNDDIR